MKLTTENIRSIALGALRVYEENGYTVLRRFTPYQEEVLAGRNFTPRQFCTAGIKLEFICPKGEVFFEYLAQVGAAATCHGVDALCDGIEAFHYYNTTNNYKGNVFFTVPYDGCKVTIYLSNISDMRIKNLNVPEGYVPAKRKRKILMLGDSITHGFNAERQYLTYANILGDRLDAEILNQGIGGDKFHAPNIDPELPFAPDIVTVAYGTNDWAAEIPELAEKIDDYFAKLRKVYPETPVFAIPPIWRGNTDGLVKNGLTLEDVRDLVREKAEKYGCLTVNSAKLVPPSEKFYMDRFLHPNDMGFILYGVTLADMIKKELKI